MSLLLKNPHSVLAALAHRPGSVTSLTLSSTKPAGAWADVLDAARKAGTPVQVCSPKPHGGRRAPSGKAGREGGSEATVHERAPLGLEDLFTDIVPDRPDLWIALDQVQDPHNLGAVFRTAAFFGVRGLILTRDRSAPLSGVVYDTATGGVEVVPFAQPANLRGALQVAKDAGLWVLGTSEHESTDVFEIPRDRPWLLVLGNEMAGMRRLTTENCDMMCRLTPRGEGVTSLNVSVAAGALIAVLTRQ